MKVSIAYANKDVQIWHNLDVDEGATVEDVIQQSGLLNEYPIDLKKQKIGIFGKLTKLSEKVSAGQRIEIYHPITRVLDEDDDDDDD